MDWKRIFITGLWFNIIEVTLIALVGGVHLFGGEVWAPVLWLAFAAAALWTILANTQDTQDESQELVLHREVFITDYWIGAFLLLMLSGMTVRYGVGYGIIFFVAAIQNLRYSAMAYDWLEEYHDDSERDNLP